MREFKNMLNELSDAIKRLLENVTSPKKKSKRNKPKYNINALSYLHS